LFFQTGWLKVKGWRYPTRGTFMNKCELKAMSKKDMKGGKMAVTGIEHF
jgi:hypothetical protein